MLHTFAVFKGREKERKEERRKRRIVMNFCVLATSVMHFVHFMSKKYKKSDFGNVVFKLRVNILLAHHKLFSIIILTLFTDPRVSGVPFVLTFLSANFSVPLMATRRSKQLRSKMVGDKGAAKIINQSNTSVFSHLQLSACSQPYRKDQVLPSLL